MKLSKIAEPRNKEDTWYIELRPIGANGSTTGICIHRLHRDKGCKDILEKCFPLATIADLTHTVADKGSGNATTCSTCVVEKSDPDTMINPWESSRFFWQAKHLDTLNTWIAQIAQPGWITSPALRGLLLKTVADFLNTVPFAPRNSQKGSPYLQPAMWVEHPALQRIRRQIQAQTKRTLENHPYTEEAAIGEACVLGAKELAGNTLGMMTSSYDLGGMGIEVYALLENWYNAISKLDGVAQATSELRQTAHYQTMVTKLPVLDDIVTQWEKTFTEIIDKHRRTVFYTTYAVNRVFDDCPRNADGAIELLGLKARTEKDGIGELPELALAWLTRRRNKPDAVLYTAAVQRTHEHLTKEQWGTAIALWSESQYGPEGVYTDSAKAIDAALKL